MRRSPTFVAAVPTPTGSVPIYDPAARRRARPSGVFAKWGRQSNVEIVLWQNRLRLGIAAALGVLAAAARMAEVLPGDAAGIGWPVIGYMSLVSIAALAVWRFRRAPAALIGLLILADLALIFGMAAVTAAPQYYSRVLLLAMLVLVFAEFHFGNGATIVAIAGTAAAYGALLAKASLGGAAIVWAEEIWLLAIWLLVAGTFAALHGSFNRRLAGLVELFRRAEEGDFTRAYDERADHRPDAITMVGRAYNAFRSQLATMVLTDSLSGCLTRRGYQQHLRRALARATRTRTALSVLLIDIDWFKSVNDSFGHLAGDEVIRELGALLRAGRRQHDIAARLGGEEFALVLPGVAATTAQMIAERLRQRIAAHKFSTLGVARRVTVSIGIADAIVEHPGISEDLHARADEALYAAKRAGRDRVVVWPAPNAATKPANAPKVDVGPVAPVREVARPARRRDDAGSGPGVLPPRAD